MAGSHRALDFTPAASLALTLTLSCAAPALAQTPPAQTQNDGAVWTALSMRGELTETGSWRWSADTLAQSRDGVNTLDCVFESVMVTRRVGEHTTVGVAYVFGAGFLDSGIASDEVLVQADARRVSAAVLDGNRLFVGIGRRLTPRSAMEIGYLNVLAQAGAHGRRRSHVLLLSLAATL